jgi:transposase
MRTIRFDEPTGRYLSFVEREEIALWRAQNVSVREVARRLERSPSTISRELRRNAATRGGKLEYRAAVAQWHRDRRASRPKAAKLVSNDRLRDYVQERLGGKIARPNGTLLDGPQVGRTSSDAMDVVRTAAGLDPGAPNRSRTGCPSTSPTIRICEYPTRRSTRPCTSRAVVR